VKEKSNKNRILVILRNTHMKISIALSAAVLAVAATPASARDFTGPYMGAGATLDNVQGSGDLEGVGFSGIGGTVFVGTNVRMTDTIFMGAEANIDGSTADVDALDAGADWGWGVSARAGFTVNESTAIYARGGYARARASVDGLGAEWADGARYGVGVETGLTERLTLRTEFSQFNFEQDVINNQVGLTLSYGF